MTILKPVSQTGRRWSFLERLDIPDALDPDRTYLRRWYIIGTPWGGLYLHHILLPDGDRALHDHPWSFVSLILRGGYTEQRPWLRPNGEPMIRHWPSARPHHTEHRMRPGRLRRMPAEGLHRITELHGDCWTLVAVGPRRREWGFVGDDGKWTDWRTYTGAPS